MKSKIGNLLKNNIAKVLGVFIFAFMCCGVMLPMHAFATSESITGSLTLELVSSGSGDSVVIDASTSSSTGAFNFFPIILGIFAVSLIVLLVCLYKTGKIKNKALSIFTLCLVVSVGFCGPKSIIANAADNDNSETQGIETSSYLKFDESGTILDNKFEIVNSTKYTLKIENITTDEEYKSFFSDAIGTEVSSNSTYEGKLKCDVVPTSLIEKAKNNSEIEGFYKIKIDKERAFPSDTKVEVVKPNPDGVFAGDVLSVKLSNFPSDATVNVKWYKVDKDGNETLLNEGEKYTVTSGEEASNIIVKVSDSTSTYTTEVVSEKNFVYKTFIDATVNIKPTKETEEIVPGDSLSCELDKFPSDAIAKYQWYRVDTEGKQTLVGEEKNYTITNNDAGNDLILKVYDERGNYYSYIESDPVLVHKTFPTDTTITVKLPQEGKDIVAGDILGVNLSNFPKDAKAKYTWYRVDSTGAETSITEGENYTVQTLDEGNKIVVKVSDSTGLYVADVSSKEVFVYKVFPEDMVVKINDSDTNIIVKTGDTLKPTVTNTPEGVTIKFKWYRTISGETKELTEGDTYTVTQDDIGAEIFCKAYDTDGKYLGKSSNNKAEFAEAYGYKDTSESGVTSLVLIYDTKKSTHDVVYNISTDATAKESWGWNDNRGGFTKVKIDESFKNYSGFTSTAYMFSDFTTASDISGFEYLDVSNVTNMECMFFHYGLNSTTLNVVPNVSNWNTSKVTNMYGLFTSYAIDSNTLNCVPDVENWDTQNVTNMKDLFEEYGEGSSVLTEVPNVSKWDTSKVTNMETMFNRYGYLNTFELLDLSSFNTKNVSESSYSSMLKYIRLKSIKVSQNWTLNLDKDYAGLTNSNGGQGQVWYDQQKNRYDAKDLPIGASLSGVVTYFDSQPPDAYAYLSGTSLTLTYDYQKASHTAEGHTVYEIPTAATQASDWKWDGVRSTTTNVAINESFKNYSGLTSTAYMFNEFTTASEISGFEYLDMSNVKDMSFMFSQYGSSSKTLNAVPDVSKWNTSKVTNMKRVFYRYNVNTNVVPNVTDWNTSRVTNMSGAFASYGCYSTTLKSVPDVSKWDTSKVTNMSIMFGTYGWYSTVLEIAPDVSKWDTSNVTDMSEMFSGFAARETRDQHYSIISKLDISKFTLTNNCNYSGFLDAMCLKSIRLGPGWTKDLSSSGANLTNSTWTHNATWYDGTTPYTNCGMGTVARTQPVTYYDTPQGLTSASNEKLLTSDTNTNQKVDNKSASNNLQNADSLIPDTQQDKSSSIEADTQKGKSSSTKADTKDKATDKTASKTDTQQTDTKDEEAEPVLNVLLNFTSSITAFFNSLKLPFV